MRRRKTRLRIRGSFGKANTSADLEEVGNSREKVRFRIPPLVSTESCFPRWVQSLQCGQDVTIN